MEAKASSVGAKTVNEPNLKYLPVQLFIEEDLYYNYYAKYDFIYLLPGPDSVSASPAFVTRSNNVDNPAFFFKMAGISWQLWSWNKFYS